MDLEAMRRERWFMGFDKPRDEDGCYVVCAETGQIAARVEGGDDDDGFATAKLLAAAPEMLDLLMRWAWPESDKEHLLVLKATYDLVDRLRGEASDA